MLSTTVSGMDTAGDKWTLTLLGKGAIQVLKQNDATTGQPAALTSKTEINSITISGTDPRSTRLIGTVVPAAGSDGRVFFQTLTETPNHSDLTAGGLGVQAVNMPNFWLGYTGSAKAATGAPVAEINIPDGINSLRIGGVDTTKSFTTNASDSPTQDGQNDNYLIRLGFPYAIGTSIVVDKVISFSQAASTSGTTTTPVSQKSVVFDVSGRINLFQANEIDGSTTNAPAASGYTGGTIVASLPPDAVSGNIGQFGFVRIGGNATNFSVITNSQLANMYIGGETNNISLLTPAGSRNLYFGKGFDTASVYTHSLENLYANRDALNSTITSERMIGDLMIGGNVANVTALSGYQAGLTTYYSNATSNISTLMTGGSTLPTAAAPPTPTAQANGQITAFIAGNVTNSVFAASDLPVSQIQTPTSQVFGEDGDAFLPLGHIVARVEGSIDNSTATPSSPKTAFYALKVDLTHGVVVPPKVVEPPLPAPTTPITLPGIPVVFPASISTKVNSSKVSTITTGSGNGSSSKPIAINSVTNPNPKATTKVTATKKK
jgi:hypothetical protein